MEYVKLVNRTSKTLTGVWDGRTYIIAPGEHSFPAIQARKFRDQNPINGTSTDPYLMDKLYLIGIVEDKDDCSPIEQSDAPSIIDLRAKIASGDYKLVPTNVSRFEVQTAPITPSGPTSTTFSRD